MVVPRATNALPIPLKTAHQLVLPERVRPGVLRLPAAGVGVFLPGAELVLRYERVCSGGPCARGVRVGNARYGAAITNTRHRVVMNVVRERIRRPPPPLEVAQPENK